MQIFKTVSGLALAATLCVQPVANASDVPAGFGLDVQSPAVPTKQGGDVKRKQRATKVVPAVQEPEPSYVPKQLC